MTTPKINVTPLIDVLLVLLIIFMVVAPLKPASFKAKVPSEPNPLTTPETNVNSLVVTVDPHLRLALNKINALGTTDDPSALVTKLEGHIRSSDKRTAFLTKEGMC